MWIHERSDWPKFFWDSATLAPILAEVRYRQGRLLGRMNALGFDVKQEASLHTLTSDVVTSSAIEGEILHRDEVRSSIAQRLGIDIGGFVPVGRNVDGIVEVMLDATQHFRSPLTAERLFGWHAALFPAGYSGLHRITVGAWRPMSAGPMQVVSGPIGREKIHFEAPKAGRLNAEMALFLAAFDADLVDVDPVIHAGLAHLWFVTIHPFEDGNGRITRAIADLALARADGSSDRFYSMSSQIEAERKAYYAQLEWQQRHALDVTPWLDWFLGCLGRSIDRAEDMLSHVFHKAQLWDRICANPVNARQRKLITLMLEGFKGHMTSSKYANITKCSTDTALRDIHELVERQILIQNNPGGRSTSYRLANADDIVGNTSKSRA